MMTKTTRRIIGWGAGVSAALALSTMAVAETAPVLQVYSTGVAQNAARVMQLKWAKSVRTGWENGPNFAQTGGTDARVVSLLKEGAAADIVYSNYFTGVHGNYLKPSILAAGMDPDNLPVADPSKMDFEQATGGAKAWKDIWGSGQGIGAIKAVEPVAKLVDRLEAEYRATRARLAL